MTVHVPDLLAKVAAHKDRVTPVDIVMGEHWAEIDLGNSMRLSLRRHMLKKQEAGKGGSSGQTRMRRIPLDVINRSQQAMVKVIKKGGTTNARGMRDQMSYLEKDGDAVLERSERYFGTELAADEQEALIESWGLSGKTKTQSDKTTHFVVSFPAETDHGAVYRAGRAWAEEMFASGTYGDVFDYYTAFHTDRAHPHIHIVVNRRGMENGDWLKVSRKSQFNYDEFRAVQVEVAAREDIVLEATPRLARGLTDRPIPDAQIREAEKEGRQPMAPSHTPVTALRAAASVLHYSQLMAGDASILHEQYPEIAKTMRVVAKSILERQGLKPASDSERAENQLLTSKEVQRKSEFIMSRRSEILNGIKTIDTEIETLPEGVDRAQFERDASRMKAQAADLMPDVQALQGHVVPNSDGYYQGVVAEDGFETDVKSAADDRVKDLARDVGIEPEKFVARFVGSEPASQDLADQWRKDEMEDIQNNLQFRDATPKDRYEELVQAAYDELHRNALQTYRKAERELETHAARKRELQRIGKLFREGQNLDDQQSASFRRTVKDTLYTSELRELEAGKSDALKYVTKDVDQQWVLSRRYLEAEQREAEGPRKLQLQSALAKLDRDVRGEADLVVQQQAARTAQKDRGLDL